MRETSRNRRKMVVVVCLVVPIALLHFFTGSAYRGPWPEFVNGYLLDILVPFAFYFLLVLPEHPLLERWPVKAALVFGAAACVEIAQFFGAPILGQTFDPVDFVMYAIGVLLAAFLDTVVLARLVGFWSPHADPSA